MNGITILNEIRVISEFWFVIPAVATVFFVFAFCAYFEEEAAPLLLFPICIGFLSTLLVFDGCKETRYEAIVSDTTPFVEVVKEYEIIERRGDIWILEPIEKRMKNHEKVADRWESMYTLVYRKK